MRDKMPNYKKIYIDILDFKYPNHKKYCTPILSKKELSFSDIISLNNIIFGTENIKNQKFRSYNKKDIFEILDYQKKNNLNNIELARHFKMSRNTIAKWKKIFVS